MASSSVDVRSSVWVGMADTPGFGHDQRTTHANAGSWGCAVTVLINVPVVDDVDAEGAGSADGVVVEVGRSDLPGELALAASPRPGEVAGTLAESLPRALDRLEPVLSALRDRFS